MNKKAFLIILDGFGISQEKDNNAVKLAKTPNIDQLFSKYPNNRLSASGEAVGLPKGVMGNSEVGHLNIGAGRIVYQMISLIDKKIDTNEFYRNNAIGKAIKNAKDNQSNLHIFGLLSNTGVHSKLKHLKAIIKYCKQENLDRVYLHAFMDGRDSSPTSGINFMQEWLSYSKETGIGKTASIMGRYYAMDRDTRWDRIQKAYDAMVYGKGNFASDPIEAIQKSYDKEITDEFIEPTVLTENNKPVATIKENDSVIFFNFRADRAREITRAFKIPEFKEFPVKNFKNLVYVSLTEYDIHFNDFVSVAFHNEKLKNILGEVVSKNNLKQLRIAETEKYAHVTFFFNGGVEKPFEGEDRILIPSPRIPSYDLQPEMSAYIVTKNLEEQIPTEKYDLIVVNYANCDMVGHTGNLKAAIQAVEAIDKCVGRVWGLAEKHNYSIVLIADHGNAEKMKEKDGKPFTAHTTNQVPVIISSKNYNSFSVNEGKLADVSPTILKLMNIDIPTEMTGNILIEENK